MEQKDNLLVPAAIQIATDLDGSETVVDFLMKDETAKLEEGTYFYIPTRSAQCASHFHASFLLSTIPPLPPPELLPPP